MTSIEQNLIRLYKSLNGTEPVSTERLPASGSYRSYFRMHGSGETVIGVHNDDLRENEAFISFTNHFCREGLPVPRMLESDPGNRIYIISDLGDNTLFRLLAEKREKLNENSRAGLPEEVVNIYKKAIGWLPVFQVKAGKSLDYSVCYPRGAFDRQSMMWDLNYFKYYFLKLVKIPFEEQALEEDFNALCDLLLRADSEYFLFRDFQSRNIMVVDGEPWFIDYQGGRKGALQYDVASLLMDGKANLPWVVRDELFNFYLDKLREFTPVNTENFISGYHGFILIRILQALGAYGFRGYYEQKAHFLQSIPYALSNLKYLRENNKLDFRMNTLMNVIDRMVEMKIPYTQPSVELDNYNLFNYNNLLDKKDLSHGDSELTVTTCSFSYKKPIPTDASGNGGGFVFDCRALPNPGRFDEYRQLNGTHRPVIEFLSKEPSVTEFLANTYSIVDQSVKTYLERGFTSLFIAFGCTGGQHRSVYCAEELAGHLRSKFGVRVRLIHMEQAISPKPE